MIKLFKKLFGIKTLYVIPSCNAKDITRGKKYKYEPVTTELGYIKDNSKTKLVIRINNCPHLKGGNWLIVRE